MSSNHMKAITIIWEQEKQVVFGKRFKARCTPKFHSWFGVLNKSGSNLAIKTFPSPHPKYRFPNLYFLQISLTARSFSHGHEVGGNHKKVHCVLIAALSQSIRCNHNHVQNSVLSLIQHILTNQVTSLPFAKHSNNLPIFSVHSTKTLVHALFISPFDK